MGEGRQRGGREGPGIDGGGINGEVGGWGKEDKKCLLVK